MTVGCELAAGSQDSNQAQQERVDPAGAATEAMTTTDDDSGYEGGCVNNDLGD
jgi:hypothetical protein